MSDYASFLSVLGSRVGHSDEDKALELWHYDNDHTPWREGENPVKSSGALVAGGMGDSPKRARIVGRA